MPGPTWDPTPTPAVHPHPGALCVGSPCSSSPPSPLPALSLPSPPYLLSSLASAPSTVPALLLDRTSPVPHGRARVRGVGSPLGALLKFVSLPTVAAPAAPATPHPGCVYTYDRVRERPGLPPPFCPLVASTRIHMYGVEAHGRRKCADYITPLLYKIAGQPSYPHRPSQIGRPFTDGPTNRSTRSIRHTDRHVRILCLAESPPVLGSARPTNASHRRDAARPRLFQLRTGFRTAPRRK